MKLRCGIEIYDRTLSTCLYRRVRFHAILAFARKLVEDGVYLYLPNERHNFQTGYQIVNNIQQVFKIDNGKIKIGLIRPCHDLTIESDMNKLKSFLRVLDHIRYSQSPYNDPVIKQNAPITDFLSYNSKKCSLGQVKVKVMVKEKSEYPTSQGFPRATEQLILRNLDSESFDRQILHLQNLRILDLSNNKISYLPKEVGTLPHLQQLLLSRNNLGNTLGSKWTWLEQTAIRHNLQFLDISSNALTELPIQMRNLQALIHLNVGQNMLTCLSHNDIKFLQNLRALDVSKNYLSHLPVTIMELRQLHFLDVRENLFTDEEPSIHSDEKIRIPNLVELSAKSILKSRIIYDASIIPYTLIKYLDDLAKCCESCKAILVDCYLRKYVYMTLGNHIEVKKTADTHSIFLKFEYYFCSSRCIGNQGIYKRLGRYL